MLTTGQKKALDKLKTGQNIFLTGKSGTGKSYVINYFVDEAKAQGKTVIYVHL